VALADVIADLVVANHVLADAGVLDAFGHVSARHPDRRNRLLLSRSIAPALVAAGDVMTFDLDGNALDGDGRRHYLERFIHGATYRRRPDVLAIVHSHSPSVIPFAAASVPLRPIYHMSGFLGAGAPVFDVRERFGKTDMLVRDRDQGAALAEALDDAAAVLMRGHGFVVVAESIAVAVYRALYTETNASLQQKAIALQGTVTYLSEEEALRADATNRGVVERPCALWKAAAARLRR
jgi:ribulose-5-phosphate 4-epimerase/fuculose-1-phosphate aldolase